MRLSSAGCFLSGIFSHYLFFSLLLSVYVAILPYKLLFVKASLRNFPDRLKGNDKLHFKTLFPKYRMGNILRHNECFSFVKNKNVPDRKSVV